MYRLSLSDYPVELHHVGVSELAHDGSLLQELDPVPLLGRGFESLDGHLVHRVPGRGLPRSSVHRTKLPRAQTLCGSADIYDSMGHRDHVNFSHYSMYWYNTVPCATGSLTGIENKEGIQGNMQHILVLS